jgi:hypothetical protein
MLPAKDSDRLWLEMRCGSIIGLIIFAVYVFASTYGIIVCSEYREQIPMSLFTFVLFTADRFLIKTGWLQQGLLCALGGAMTVVTCSYLYRLWKAATAKLY